MKISNKTEWDTRDLRTYFLRGLKAKGADPRKYRIYVHYSKAGGRAPAKRRGGKIEGWVDENGISMHGWARLNLPIITMFTPRGEFDLDYFGRVFEHEIDHTLGLHHKDMIDIRKMNPLWVKGLSIQKKKTKEKQVKNVVVERANHAEKMMKKWERNIKRAETHFKKWKKKVKYYEQNYPQ